MAAPSSQQLRELIKHELPALLRDDPELQEWVLELARQRFADRQQTEGRFEQMLAELQAQRQAFTAALQSQREEQNQRFEAWEHRWEQERKEQSQRFEAWERKWEQERKEQNQRFEAWERKWEQERKEQSQRFEAWERKWQEDQQEQNRKREEDRQEQNRKWEEQNRKQREDQQEQNRKWAANQEELNHLHEEVMAMIQRQERAVGALGARWGMSSETAFRNALAGILEDSFGVQVLNVNEYDDEGVVFGRPDQVELDVIIANGILILCELKSSLSKADLYTFKRKAEFYEHKHDRKANRLLVISPMIDARARPVGRALGIEMYSDSLDVETL